MIKIDIAAERYRIGDLLVDAGRRCVVRGAATIRLPKLSLDLLLVLIRSAPNMVSNDDLLEQVWGDTVVGHETITQRVKLIRHALGDDSHDPRYIELICGEGYRLCTDVERVSAEAPLFAHAARSKFLRPTAPLAVALLSVSALLLLLNNGPTIDPASTSDDPAKQSAADTLPQVVRSLQPGLLPAEERRQANEQSATDEIEHLHRIGRDALANGDFTIASRIFRAVIELDPDRAQAHADLAGALMKMGWFTTVSSGEVIPQSEAEARRALEIDPSLAEPYLVLANAAAFYHWDWENAELLYQTALDRNPGHAPTYLDYAAYLFVVGRIEAGLQQIHQAEAVDPFSAETQGQIGVLYHHIRHWEAAHRYYDAAIRLQPDNLLWQLNKGCTYILQGDFDRAAAIITGSREAAPGHPMPMVIDAYFAAVTGDAERARALLQQLDAVQLSPLAELLRASVYVALHRDGDALQLLQLARENRLLTLPFSAIHPTHDPLRLRADYASLLTGLGLDADSQWQVGSVGASL